ncbi:MAG: hypothetical protein QXU40_02955 [Candidatus Pacearchaeota archaeon]
MEEIIVKMRIMPESQKSKIEELELGVKKIFQKKKQNNFKTEIQPIAFGLNALIILFSWPEEEPLESIEKEIKSIKGVGSVDVLDMRRSIG